MYKWHRSTFRRVALCSFWRVAKHFMTHYFPLSFVPKMLMCRLNFTWSLPYKWLGSRWTLPFRWFSGFLTRCDSNNSHVATFFLIWFHHDILFVYSLVRELVLLVIWINHRQGDPFPSWIIEDTNLVADLNLKCSCSKIGG